MVATELKTLFGIEFPLLLLLRGNLTVEKDERILQEVDGMKFPSKATMLCKANAKLEKKETPGWILSVDGIFVSLEPAGRQREWAAPLHFLVRVVLSEYKVSEPRDVTVGDLLGRLRGVRNGSSESSIAGDLKRHLMKYESYEVISSKILKEWPI